MKPSSRREINVDPSPQKQPLQKKKLTCSITMKLWTGL